MKKILILLFSLVVFTTSFAIEPTGPKPSLNANDFFIPVGNTGEKISLMELSRISLKDFEALTNRKMKFFDRLTFKASQKKLKKSINSEGIILNKKLEKYYKADGDTSFHGGGFALGLLLGLIGVLIAYLINDDKKRARRKWAWIGWGVWVGILLIIIAAGGSVY